MSLGVGLEHELGHDFGGDFDDFDEFGGAFAVCSLHLEMRSMNLGNGLDEWFALQSKSRNRRQHCLWWHYGTDDSNSWGSTIKY